jgi:chaperone modulatory protein CbpM
MAREIILTGVVVDDTTTFTLTQIRQHYHIPEELLQEMLEYGLLEPIINGTEAHVNIEALQRLHTALHLHEELGINMPGVALALDLIDALTATQNELAILHNHLK